MASKKKGVLSQYCRIFQYVEAQDPDLAAAVRDLCMEGALAAHGAGVTFLYPKEKSFREEIVEKTYSDADAASKLVSSLIIPDALLTGEDWQRKPVGNYAGVLYEVKSASGANVVLKGEDSEEVKLKRDDAFKTRSDKEGRLAVWTIVSGRPPLSGGEYHRPGRQRAPKKGAERKTATGGAGNSARAALAGSVEAAYNAAMLHDRAKSSDPYLSRVVGLLNHLRANQPELLKTLLPLLDWCPAVDFYLLVEPYKSGEKSDSTPDGADYLIPDAVLFGPAGWNGAEAFGDPKAGLKEFINSVATVDKTETAPMVFRNAAAVVRQIDTVRQQIQQNLQKLETPMRIHRAYETLAGSNSIAGMENILPAETQRLLPGAKKFWQDQMRFLLQHALCELREGPHYNPREFQKVVDLVRFDAPGNNYKKELRICDVEMLKRDVAPNAPFYLVMKFLCSSDFLYIPAAEGKIGGARGDVEDPTDRKVYNRNYEAHRQLEMTSSSRSGLSPHALGELRMYVTQFGELPPEVRALEKREKE